MNSITGYFVKLPDFWADSEVISLRYEKPNKKLVFFKFITLHDELDIHAVSEENKETLLSMSMRYYFSAELIVTE